MTSSRAPVAASGRGWLGATQWRALPMAMLIATVFPVATLNAQPIRFSRGVTLTLTFDEQPGLRPFALADLNADAKPDIVAAARDPEGSIGLAVALNDGSGGFSSFVFFHEPGGMLDLPAALTVADFASPTQLQPDGIPDVAIVSANHLFIAAGDGSGHFTFSDAVIELGTAHLVDVVSGDFDGRNGVDLALVDASGLLHTLCSVSGGGLTQCAGSPISTGGDNAGPIARGDLNGDGALDLAVLNRGTEDARATLAFLLGHGDGSFALMTPVFDAGKPNATDIAVGRLDDDALDDVAVTFLEPFGGDSVQVFLGRANGRPRSGGVLQGLSFMPAAVAIADFDADGINDLVAPQLQDDLVTAVMRGTGSAQFDLVGSSLGLVTGPAVAVDVADLDDDHLPDIVVLRTDHQQLRVAINISDQVILPTATHTATASATPTASMTATPTPTDHEPAFTATATATMTVAVPTATRTNTNTPASVDDDGCAIDPHSDGGFLLMLPVLSLLWLRGRTSFWRRDRQ